MGKSSLKIKNLTRSRPPRFPWLLAKNRVLGKGYELSLVLIGKRRAQTLNRVYRAKNKPANVLSFSLTSHLGEIFLNLDSTENLFYLFIHGLCHLAGFAHGSKMEDTENSLGRFFGFNFNEERNCRGPRYRDRLHPRDRGRTRSQ